MTTSIPLERLKAIYMARKNQTFADYGVDDDPEMFTDRLVEMMHGMYAAFTIDELLLRPREALKFCDAVRGSTGHVDLPDDVILRLILNRRKQG